MKPYLPLVIFLLLACSVIAQSEPTESEDPKRTPAVQQTLRARKEAIRAEIKQLGSHEWAGEYYYGDGSHDDNTLILSPRAGFVFEWRGSFGTTDCNYGEVTESNGKIRLSCKLDNEKATFGGIVTEMILVPWGERRYLIATNEIVAFCNEVNQGKEPERSMYSYHFLRTSDEEKHVTGFPKLPKEYLDYLLATPVEAKIIAVGAYTTKPSIMEWKFKITPFTIDAGTSKGLRVGMELVATTRQGHHERATITKVAENTAEAVISQAGEDELGPEVGWSLSTLVPWKQKK